MMVPETTDHHATAKAFLALGALFGLVGVLAGAAGAHALHGPAGRGLFAIFHTGVQYEFYHALALLVVGGLVLLLPRRGLLIWAGGLFSAGIVLFSGSLYLIAFSGAGWPAVVTPIGGTAFILGWIALLLAILRNL